MTQYVKIINGDLLNSQDYIVHQCNCVSTNVQALAKLVFDKYPQANSYTKRIRYDTSTYSIPGTIEIYDNVINIYSQYYPAQAKYGDTYEMRIKWFRECLDKISNLNIKTLSMPYNIGCGAAKGNWSIYYKMICDFAENEKINVTLYKL
jgi:hypothetical protein